MKYNNLKILLIFSVICICAYMVRDIIYERDTKLIIEEYEGRFGKDIDFIPFLVESSMMYSYASDVAYKKGIKEFDPSLQGMNNISVHKQFTTGLEYFLGYGYKIKNFIYPSTKQARAPNDYEDNPDFTKWSRIQLRVWISLISGLIFLWLVIIRIPLPIAFLGGALHAVAPSAIARYTAQDIVRGNFSLPLILATFVSAYWFIRKPNRRKLILTGIVAFLALATWDMTQIVFSVWCLAEITRILAGGKPSRKRKYLWWMILFSGISASALIPYHREHLLILSPLVFILLPMVIILHYIAAGRKLKIRIANFAIFLTLFFIIWLIISKTGAFAKSYGHFTELIIAKLQFMNVKPLNPNLLSFNARSIWVPAMHSANRYITKSFFPMMLHITAITLILSLVVNKIRESFFRMMGIVNFPLFMTLFYSISFFFIVRYHVFVSIFICILFPILLNIWLKNAKQIPLKDCLKSIFTIVIYFTLYNLYFYSKFTFKSLILYSLPAIYGVLFGLLIIAIVAGYKKCIRKTNPPLFYYSKILIYIFVFYLFIFEIDALNKPRHYNDRFFPQTAALIKWIRKANVEDAVLADFQLSPLLKAYTHSKIILQPKFELGETRKDYKDFINIMFNGNENELADFCYKKGARYFIYDRGYPNQSTPDKYIYSSRYIAGVDIRVLPEQLKKDSPVYMMNFRQNRIKLRNFYEILPPQNLKRTISERYIIFQVITPEDKIQAKEKAEEARVFWRLKKMDWALKAARSAVFADPNCPEAVYIYNQVWKRHPQITLKGY